MRMTYSSRQRLKTGLIAAFVFFFLYLIFFSTPDEEYNPVHRVNLYAKEPWKTFSKHDTYPRVVRSKAFAILSDNLGGKWSSASIDQFVFEKLSGGFTNLVFKCSLNLEETPPVVLKILFPKMESDKNREVDIMNLMSNQKMGPQVLAEFESGRIEEFIEGREVTEEEMKSRKFASEIGRNVAMMHSQNQEHIENQLIPFLRRYLDRIIRSENVEFPLNPTLSFSNVPRAVTVGILAQEIDKINVLVTRNFNFPTVLIHNDIFNGNVRVQKKGEDNKPEEHLMLIDYEFSMFGHRAADIVGYITDFAKNPHQEVGTNPSEADIAFLHGYLNSLYVVNKTPDSLRQLKLTGNIDIDTQTLLKEAYMYWPVWNFFWGLEHIVSHIEGNNMLNYEELYMNRLAAYFSLKLQ